MFAATYVINLAHSADRWQAMQPVLAAMGVRDAIRFDAVDGAALGDAGVADFQQRGWLAPGLEGFDAGCRAGEIGCALSHAGVLRDVVQQGWAHALILEDDIELAGNPADWRRRCIAAFADLPQAWDLWYLYRCFDIEHRAQRVTRRTVIPWTPQGGAAYAVSLPGARKLLAALSPVASAVDRTYSDLVQRRQVDAWAASPMLVVPGAQPSIINRANQSKQWVVEGINRPPEYWPRPYLAHLGEAPPNPLRRAWNAVARRVSGGAS